MSEFAFEAADVTFRYPGDALSAVDSMQLAVRRGVVTALLGPNGSGKSTLLKLLLGVLTPDSGRILYGGVPLERWGRRELARRIGVVPQGEETVFPISVREMVALGRYPRLGPLAAEGNVDRQAIGRALSRCDLEALSDRSVLRLSGGERQRTLLARALAQEPETLVLDEPTVSLDIRHEMELFELLLALSRTDGTTILLATHNLNLAARYADELVLLKEGRLAGSGPPEEVLSRAALEEVYQWPVTLFRHQGAGRDAGAPQVAPLAGRRPSGSPPP